MIIITYLYIQCGVETHLQVSLTVLLEDALETLLENGSIERIGKDHDTTCRVDHGLHLK